MYTGIVQGLCSVLKLEKKTGLFTLAIDLGLLLSENLQIGASVAINGVCLTVSKIEGSVVYFDVMEATLSQTTLNNIQVHQEVNVERSLRFGDEIGGHILSGHIYGTCKIIHIEKSENNQINTFEVPSSWMKNIFTKGFIGLDGASLTVVDTDSSGKFRVAFIPETLEKTVFGWKKEGDLVNLEIDSGTQAIVETVERVLKERGLS